MYFYKYIANIITYANIWSKNQYYYGILDSKKTTLSEKKLSNYNKKEMVIVFGCDLYFGEIRIERTMKPKSEYLISYTHPDANPFVLRIKP